MKLHELEILHEDLIDITIGKKTFVNVFLDDSNLGEFFEFQYKHT